MIIHKKSKSVETLTGYPNENFGAYSDVFVIDDSSNLGKKILDNQCNFEFVLDDEGNLTDIIRIDRPTVSDPPTETEILWQTVTDLQLELIMTNQFLTEAQIEIEILKGGIS